MHIDALHAFLVPLAKVVRILDAFLQEHEFRFAGFPGLDLADLSVVVDGVAGFGVQDDGGHERWVDGADDVAAQR